MLQDPYQLRGYPNLILISRFSNASVITRPTSPRTPFTPRQPRTLDTKADSPRPEKRVGTHAVDPAAMISALSVVFAHCGACVPACSASMSGVPIGQFASLWPDVFRARRRRPPHAEARRQVASQSPALDSETRAARPASHSRQAARVEGANSILADSDHRDADEVSALNDARCTINWTLSRASLWSLSRASSWNVNRALVPNRPRAAAWDWRKAQGNRFPRCCRISGS